MATRARPVIDFDAFAKEHLSYEAEMFAQTRDRVQSLPPGLEHNVFVESCVLHFRNLMDFFYPAVSRADDVIALDYDPGWDSAQPPISGILSAARERAHKELAHLTTNRKSDSAAGKNWDFCKIAAELRPVTETFIKRLSTILPQEAVTSLQRAGSVPTMKVVIGPGVVGSSRAAI